MNWTSDLYNDAIFQQDLHELFSKSLKVSTNIQSKQDRDNHTRIYSKFESQISVLNVLSV